MFDRFLNTDWFTARPGVALFIFALTVRWVNALTVFWFWGNDGLMSGDSFGFLSNAQLLAGKIASGAPPSWDWLGTDIAVMPLYPWLLTTNVLIAESFAPIVAVLIQGAIDAITCTVVYRIARRIDPPSAIVAGIVAAINPTQIVLSGIIYTDTTFLFFSTLFLLALLRWHQAATWRSARLIAFAGGLAAITRVLIVPWIVFSLALLLLAKLWSRHLGREHVMQLLFAGIVVAGCLLPVVIRNASHYGAWALTPQGGAHLAYWVAPLVGEAANGTPRDIGARRAQLLLRERYPDQHPNAFVESQRLTEVGREQMRDAGYLSIAKAWVIGAIINLATPAALISPPVATLPHGGFYETRGGTVGEKVFNFIFRGANTVYLSILLVGAAGIMLFRALQLLGFFSLFRRRGADLSLAILVLWVGFVLAINGPIASPKYRLPIEPVLCVFAATGLSTLLASRRRARKLDRAETGL